MSKYCAPPPPRNQRFKGIENFLRRIAFNLGNTPSQTEVKIISCIPIDVTDLQHKILALEKQLEGVKGGGNKGGGGGGSKGGGSKGGGGGWSKGGGSSGGGGGSGAGGGGGRSPAGPNSGRSAVYSATHRECRNNPTLRSAMCTPPTVRPAALPHTTPTASSRTASCVSSRQKKSAVSFEYASGSQHVQRGSERCDGDAAIRLQDDRDDVRAAASLGADRPRDIHTTKKPRADKKKDKWKTQYVYHAQITDSPFTRYRNSPEYTCRAAPPPAPAPAPPPPAPRTTISHAYLAAVVRKQYQPERVDMLSGTSQFSAPVCRDAPRHLPAAPARPPTPDLRVCSCCSVPFHNIDSPLQPSDDFFPTPPLACAAPHNTMYYDSSLYDLVPVREKPTDARNEEEYFKKKEPKSAEHRTCTCPRRGRARPRLQPYAVNYHTAAAARASRKTGCKRKLPLRPPTGISPKRKYFESQLETSNTCSFVCGGVYAKQTPGSRRVHRTSTSEPPTEPKLVVVKNAECLTISVNNTECQTAASKSVQLEPPATGEPDGGHTEVTLNQIKAILQSVLTEMKTSTLGKPVTEVKSRRDAVAQKGQSQNNIQTCSSLVDGYNCSPYNMYGASCSRTLPAQLYYPGGGCPPVRCVQNYPLFIHTTGRQCACCYRGLPAQLVGAAEARSAARHAAAATTATNTDASAARNQGKETDNLIKEIYKSIDLEYPRKDTSTSGGEDVKPMFNTSPKIEFKYIPSKPSSVASRRTSKGASSVVARHELASTAQSTRTGHTSHTVNTTFTSDVGSKAASVRSRCAGTSASDRAGTSPSDRATLDRYIHMARESTLDDLAPPPRPHSQAVSTYTSARPEYYDYDTDETDTPDVPYSSPESPYSPEPDSPDTADDSDDTIVPVVHREPAKPKSRGLFSTMAKLFKGRMRRQRSASDPDERTRARRDEPDSDSDDYETVYSDRSRQPARRARHVPCMRDRSYRRRPHSKLTAHPRYYVQRREQPRELRVNKSPYMEQEYRRQWNENLAFHANRVRYSTDRPPTRDSKQSRERRRSPYWQSYEAHPAAVTRDHTPDDNRFTSDATPPHTAQPDVNSSATKRLAWLKKNKLLKCGESRLFKCGKQWKKFILDG